ncbi:protein strawberry notch homolog 1-like [Hydractinia symbiolongicarpus]|uniref:protein strawberry notch homolog 1-like n=1 Tax=Hydractinia symbiolongicarpus TaxID=13093 RepID=UPI002549F2EF|nr:protein strawberry notch homolog 1-like [Hydractinia symbiolongicarpus]
MDDILSAALGQSGLNLSFLEEQHESVGKTSTNSQVTSKHNIVINAGNPVQNEETGENEDVTDLLNLLDDPVNPVTTSKLTPGSSNGSDMLNFLLNYNSDEEVNTPTTVPSPSLERLLENTSDFRGLSTQFPKIKPQVAKPKKVNPPNLGGKNIMCTSPKISLHTPQRINKSISVISRSNQIIINKISSNKTSRSNSPVTRLTTPSGVDLTKNVNSTFQKDEITDLERKKQSIEHVLASPNLTLREREFIMKTALSHNVKPTLPPNNSSRGLSSLLNMSLNQKIENNEEEDDEDEENGMIRSETFAEYMPAKVKVGYLHPDPVVETSSMASVAPPDVWYSLQLPLDIINERKLSALQLESVVYASQQHEKLLPSGKRAGFLIGDGAGVGKGRTVAGVIFENYLRGRKRAIWLSVSNDLRFDAIRDLRDIGCHAKVHALNKFKYDDKITSKANGKFKKGCIFSTYSALIGETSGKARFKSRLDQLLHWCGKDFDGVIILDECHKAKNLMPVGSSKPTKTGLTVLMLQDQLPKARVVYCSATGASEPKNMAYMNRLGLWGQGTAFRDFAGFLQSVEKRGVGAMEMVAMDMKLRGMYIARQLSFAGVTFDIKEVKLCSSFIEMYDASVKLWLDARTKFEEAANLVGLDGKGRKTMWGQFWSAHQRFFKYLCIAAKVGKAVIIAKEAIETGKCVIFGLQSTGEARTLDQIDELGGELNDFISTTKGVFSTLVEKHFPTTETVNNCYNTEVDERKRKRDWRKPLRKSSKRRKVVNGDVEFMTSDSSSESENEIESANDSNKDTVDSTQSEKDSDAESESEEKDPFADTSSGSDDEDAWLRAADNKKAKKEEKISKLKLKRVGTSVDSSMNALAAAGFNLGRQYSWTNTSLSGMASTENMKSNRSDKVVAPQGLSQQISNLKRSQSMKFETKSQQCRQMKQSLLDQLEIIAPYLPPNTLDELIDELGGPEYVAEMTGRKGRVVAKSDGSFAYEPRSKDDVPLEVLNVEEKKRFMRGEKLVAVISEAASSGISLQADRREQNQRRRVHITLELPWSADKAIQQFGRSHRSNQVSAPEYLFLISELAGEQRFASIVAKRLESLGALTHGDRRATESRDLSRYNFDTKYGRQALDVVFKSVIGHEKPLVNPEPPTYKGVFMEDVKKSLIGIGLVQKDERTGVYSIADKDYTNISRFLNRILGLTVALQNALFSYFTETLAAVIKEAKRSGRWDEGIVDLGSQGESVVQSEVKTFLCPSTCGQVTTELRTVSVERGLSFSKAVDMARQCQDPNEGFYLSSQLRNGKKTAVLILRQGSAKKTNSYTYSVYRPNIGLVQKAETIKEIRKKYEKASASDVELNWNEQYDYSESNCSHAFWRGYCKRKLVGLSCEVGARKKTCHILCGSVLSVWSKVETILSCQPGPHSKMQIIRSKLDNGLKLVGLLIPSNCIDALVRVLTADDTIEQQF